MEPCPTLNNLPLIAHLVFFSILLDLASLIKPTTNTIGNKNLIYFKIDNVYKYNILFTHNFVANIKFKIYKAHLLHKTQDVIPSHSAILCDVKLPKNLFIYQL